MEGIPLTKKKHKAITITPHLFQLGIGSFPVYLSMGKEGMIIEGGTGPTFEIIVDQVASLGIDPLKIKYLTLTHTHPDHIGALPRLKRIWPHLKVLAGTVASKFLKREGLAKEFLVTDRIIGEILKERGDIDSPPPELDEYNFEADVVLNEGDTIDLGKGIVWKVYNTPGHSPCHIALHEEKEGTLVIGDITGYHDPELGAYWPNYFQSLEEYCNSIRKMSALPTKRCLLSHNGVIEGDVRTHLEKSLKAAKAYHLEMIEKLDKGLDAEQITQEQTEWVDSLGALTTLKIIQSLCKLMLRHSQENREKDISFELEAASN
jgi:glyoxylase-like metal-dependent hydrolase (beta-lactamase superfamily II)